MNIYISNYPTRDLFGILSQKPSQYRSQEKFFQYNRFVDTGS